MSGQINLSTVQLGTSATASQNFFLEVPAVQDGTLALKRGNAGSSLGTILSVDASGNVVGTTAAQFDNSSKLATTGFVKRAGTQFGSMLQTTGATTLTAAQAGGLVVIGGGGGYTVTLPSTSAFDLGSTITFSIQSGSATIQRGGTDLISIGPNQSNTSFTLSGSDFVTLVNYGGGFWVAVSGTSLLQTGGTGGVFAASKTGNGYQKLPSGLIVQWGLGTSINTGDTVITLPVAWPNSLLSATAIVTFGGASSPAFISSGPATSSTVSFGVFNTASVRTSGNTFFWQAIGH